MEVSNTINGKTLEEIFKALKCIVIQFNDSCDELWDDCRSCPHNVDGGRMDLAKCVADAAALIQQQERQLAEKDARIAELERERDAAVEDIRKAAFCGCHVCKHYYRPDPNVRKYSCKKYGDFDKHDFIADDGSIFCGAMEWRGVQEVE